MEQQRQISKLAALGLLAIAIVIAVAPSVRRRTHPLRWARRNAHEVVDPIVETGVHLLGLDTPAQGSADVAADAVIAAIGITESLRHPQRPRGGES